MSKDKSNVPLTCPLIDSVLDFLDYVHEIEDREEIRAQANVFKDTMELIREANIELRRWGNKQELITNGMTVKVAITLHDPSIELPVVRFRTDGLAIAQAHGSSQPILFVTKSGEWVFGMMRVTTPKYSIISDVRNLTGENLVPGFIVFHSMMSLASTYSIQNIKGWCYPPADIRYF